MTTKEFNQIYLDNKNKILKYVSWKINNKHDAEDLTSQVFIKAYRLINGDNEAHRFNPEKSDIKTWLITIANCTIIDFWRTNHENQYQKVSDFVNVETDEETFQFIASRSTDANFNIENNELRDRLKKAFKKLNPKYEKIAILYFQDELKYTEIAEECNVPLGTVKGMINRIREKLQSELKDLHEVKRLKIVV